MAIVIKGLMILGAKCHQNNSPVVWDGYVKYEEAEVDRLIAILKTNNCGGGGGGGPCGLHQSPQYSGWSLNKDVLKWVNNLKKMPCICKTVSWKFRF